MAGKDNQRISKALVKWIKGVAESYQQKLRDANIRYTGELEDLVSFGVRGDSSDDILSAAYTLEAFLLLAPEWKYVEDGRLSGTFPNVDALLAYVRFKPIIPQPYVLPSGKQIVPTENSIAFLIGRKIKEDGIAPNPILFETLEEHRPLLLEAIQSAVTEAVREKINLIFEI